MRGGDGAVPVGLGFQRDPLLYCVAAFLAAARAAFCLAASFLGSSPAATISATRFSCARRVHLTLAAAASALPPAAAIFSAAAALKAAALIFRGLLRLPVPRTWEGHGRQEGRGGGWRRRGRRGWLAARPGAKGQPAERGLVALQSRAAAAAAAAARGGGGARRREAAAAARPSAAARPRPAVPSPLRAPPQSRSSPPPPHLEAELGVAAADVEQALLLDGRDVDLGVGVEGLLQVIKVDHHELGQARGHAWPGAWGGGAGPGEGC
jgi:hypothetical protein